VHFGSPNLHPTCALLVWLATVLGVQFVGYVGMAVLSGVALLLVPQAATRWLVYVRRAKWLLLTLWLILAYNTPGEAWLDRTWLPTHEGIAEANLQAVRLVVMLLWLSWLFVRLGRDGLVGGLWGLLKPFRWVGLEVERLVVRLSLVLENLQEPPEKGAWRRVLHVDAALAHGPSALSLATVPWTGRDTLIALSCLAGLMGVLLV
jgi:energy-coupling factor transporter transmembrane protein EcfT